LAVRNAVEKYNEVQNENIELSNENFRSDLAMMISVSSM